MRVTRTAPAHTVLHARRDALRSCKQQQDVVIGATPSCGLLIKKCTLEHGLMQEEVAASLQQYKRMSVGRLLGHSFARHKDGLVTRFIAASACTAHRAHCLHTHAPKCVLTCRPLHCLALQHPTSCGRVGPSATLQPCFSLEHTNIVYAVRGCMHKLGDQATALLFLPSRLNLDGVTSASALAAWQQLRTQQWAVIDGAVGQAAAAQLRREIVGLHEVKIGTCTPSVC